MKVERERTSLELDGVSVPSVTAEVHEPRRPRGPAVLLAHGAGGDLDAEPLVALADVIAAQGHRTVRVNLPYRESGRKAPPRAERTAEELPAIVAAARRSFGPRRDWVVGGKSYGGRVASLAVAAGLEVHGLLFYGYPLHPSGRPDRLRVSHWPDIPVPCLFLQGTHDPLAELELLESNLPKLPRRATLLTVDGGDHSLSVAKRRSPSGEAEPASTVLAAFGPDIGDWIQGID